METRQGNINNLSRVDALQGVYSWANARHVWFGCCARVCVGGMCWWYVLVVCVSGMCWWYVLLVHVGGMCWWYVLVVCVGGMC